MAKQRGMWEFFEVSRPKTSKKTKEQVLEQQREYDSKRRIRAWRPEWQTDHPWLELREQDGPGPGSGKMFCTVCCQYETVGTFVTGNGSFKVESVKAHAASEGHKRNNAKLEAAKDKPGCSQAHQILQKLNASQYNRLGKLFRTVHALCLKGRPYTDFVWMAQLDRMKGLDVGHSYINHQRAKEFAHFIAEAMREPIRERLRSVKFLSLMTDGATDTSSQEAEMVYSRVADAGVVTSAFIGVVNIERADASGIIGALSTAMSRHMKLEPAEWQRKLVGFGSDGASVNVGKKSGVIAKLKGVRPEVQPVHCMAHR